MWRYFRLRKERLAEQPFGAPTAKFEGDIYASGRVTQDGQGWLRKLGEVVRVGEVEGVTDSGFPGVVRTKEHAEASRKRTSEVARGGGAEAFYRH